MEMNRMRNNEFMNPPVQHNVTDMDIIAEYNRYNDAKKVAKIFDLSVQDVKEVLKMMKE